MAVQRTLVLVKPDGVRRKVVGEIVRRLENKGFDIVAMRMLTVDDELAKRHYEEHLQKPFFPELLAFITSGPTVAMAIEGEEAVATVRAMMGATNPLNAPTGTIRGDYGLITTENLVHGSDSPESASRELSLFFPDLP